MKSQASLEANRRYYQRNKDRIRERQRQWRVEHREEARARARKTSKAHYWANRDECLDYHKARYHAKKSDPEFHAKRLAYSKAYYKNNKEKHQLKSRNWRLQNYSKYLAAARANHYQRKYGMTIAERDSLFAANKGFCHICSKRPSEVVDHDHATGRVRGALCHPCNRMLGAVFDDPEVLLAGADYLRRELCVIS